MNHDKMVSMILLTFIPYVLWGLVLSVWWLSATCTMDIGKALLEWACWCCFSLSKHGRKTGALGRTFASWLQLQNEWTSFLWSSLIWSMLPLLSCPVCRNSTGIANMVLIHRKKAIRCAAGHGLGYQDLVDEAVQCLHVTKIECHWALQWLFGIVVYPLLRLICAGNFLGQVIPLGQEVIGLPFARCCVHYLVLELSPFQISGIACQHCCRVRTSFLNSRLVFWWIALRIPSWSLLCPLCLAHLISLFTLEAVFVYYVIIR